MRTKNKKLRLISLILGALLALGMLTACDKGESGNESDTTPTQAETSEETPTEEPTVAETTVADLAPADILSQIQNPSVTTDLSKNLAIDMTLTLDVNMTMGGSTVTVSVPITMHEVTADGAILVTVTADTLGTATNVSMYWKDNVLYSDYGEGVTMKTATDWTQAQELFQSTGEYDIQLLAADLFQSVTAAANQDGSVTVTCKGINAEAYETLIADSSFSTWLSGLGILEGNYEYDEEGNLVATSEMLTSILQQFTEDNYVFTYTVNAEGTLVAATFDLRAEFSEEDVYTTSYHVTGSYTYTYGGQTVTIPEDAANWTEVSWDEFFNWDLGGDVEEETFGEEEEETEPSFEGHVDVNVDGEAVVE
jgi:hypothetical protein